MTITWAVIMRVKLLRLFNGITIKELETKSGSSWVLTMEYSSYKTMDVSTINFRVANSTMEAIAGALNTTSEFLMKGKGEMLTIGYLSSNLCKRDFLFLLPILKIYLSNKRAPKTILVFSETQLKIEVDQGNIIDINYDQDAYQSLSDALHPVKKTQSKKK